MDADVKVIKHYLERALSGRPIDLSNRSNDCQAELDDACQSLSSRLERLEDLARTLELERGA